MTKIFLAAFNWHDFETAEKLDFSILCSLEFMDDLEKTKATLPDLPHLLDSGAFTAWRKKREIDEELLLRECQSGRWWRAAALDVIGDPEKSYQNALRYMELDPRFFPTFHYGDPWWMLGELCDRSNFVAIGGTVGLSMKERERFFGQVFSRRWPHAFHSFGCTTEKLLKKFPFYSADSSSWSVGVGKFATSNYLGRSVQFKGLPSSLRYPLKELEAERYLRMERELVSLWGRELAQLDASPEME